MADSGYVMSSWDAMLFFRTCKLYKIVSREDRLALLGRMAARKKARYVRDVNDITQDKSVARVVEQRNDYRFN